MGNTTRPCGGSSQVRQPVKVRTKQQRTRQVKCGANQPNHTDRMASSLLSKMVSSKVEGFFKTDSDDEKTPHTQKELKEEDKRKQAQKAAEEERKKKHVQEEYQREKKRQEIRDKYGIAKKGNNSKDKSKDKDLLEEIKKDCGVTDLEARELQRKMNEESEERDATKKKVDKKMENRALKKEIKKDLGVDKCKQQ